MRLLVMSVALALGSSIACAATDDSPDEATTPPPGGGSLPDASSVDAAPEEDSSIPSPMSECSRDGFCYVTVAAQQPLTAVSASSADDAWMLAENSGSLFRWDGTVIRQVYTYEGMTPASVVFSAIWAQKKDVVWAAARANTGQIFLVRYASPLGGGAPELRELPTAEPANTGLTIWGTPAGDALWIATDQSVLRVHEEESGAVIEPFDPAGSAGQPGVFSWRGVWGFGPDDIYVAGRVCPTASCAATAGRGAIGHYDGSSWTLTTIDSVLDIQSLRGTPPGSERRLWYTANVGENSVTIMKTFLAPITAEGAVGEPLFIHPGDVAPACSSHIGQATSPSAGWFSNGLLVCRWTGDKFEPAETSLAGRPVIHTVGGIWASGEDVWIVGSAVRRADFPAGAFAARRTADTVAGGQR